METVGECFDKLMEDQFMKAWFESRPVKVQELVKMYPYEFYIMADNAPYMLCPKGTVVELVSYKEKGTITVDIWPIFMTEEGKENLRLMCQMYNNDYGVAENSVHRVEVEPKYLIPYESPTE